MEEHLGRYLTGLEVVHHEDGDKENNAIQNLRLFPSQAHHIRYHQVKAAKRYNPEIVAMVRAAAADPLVRKRDLPMSPMTVDAICRENGIEWVRPEHPHLDEAAVREALRGRTTIEAAKILGCNHQTLRNHWDHLLVKRKSPTRRKPAK